MDNNYINRFRFLSSSVDTGENISEEETVTDTTEETGYQQQFESIIENQEEIIEQNNMIYQGLMNILLCIVVFFVLKFFLKQFNSWFNGS